MSLIDKAEKKVEFQVNHEKVDEDLESMVVIDCDHTDTEEEARQHSYLDEDHWSIEKVESWAINGSLVKREHTLVEDSRGDSDE